MTEGVKELEIRSHLTITPAGKAPFPATLAYVAHLDGASPNEGKPFSIPGTAAGVMTVQGVSAAEESVVLNVTGLGGDFVAATPETLSVDVTRKPLISLVWGGFYVMMFGGLLAFIKRSGQARAAVLAEEKATSESPATPTKRPLRPAPAHARAET
jgi:hypothetical protein